MCVYTFPNLSISARIASNSASRLERRPGPLGRISILALREHAARLLQAHVPPEPVVSPIFPVSPTGDECWTGAVGVQQQNGYAALCQNARRLVAIVVLPSEGIALGKQDELRRLSPVPAEASPQRPERFGKRRLGCGQDMGMLRSGWTSLPLLQARPPA